MGDNIHKQTIAAMRVGRAVRVNSSDPLLRVSLKLNDGGVQTRVLIDHSFVQIVYGPVGADVISL